MTNKYKVLFAPVDAVGHVNACIGVAEQVRNRGHTVVFATPISWKGKLETLGFQEEVYSISDSSPAQAVGEVWWQLVKKLSSVISLPSIDLLDKFHINVMYEAFRQVKFTHLRLKEILETVKPDVVIVDHLFCIPALMDQGVPWILSVSISPLGSSNINVPPAFSGYPVDGDRELWKKFNEEVADVFKDLLPEQQEWCTKNGGPIIEFKYPFLVNFSPWANIYMYPKELDYTMHRQNPPNWYQFDGFVRESNEKFEIPEKLKNGPGKLIYFSMGTVGSSDVGLMRRLISILGKSPNRFIVSKGPLGAEIELPSNMWGKNSVPQVAVIPLVDLVISHGGNNSLTETFYFGKRILVLPLLWDQLDNGQRIYETGLGLRFYPYKVTETELLEGIELLLHDTMLEKRMSFISKRIQSGKSQTRAAELVERIAASSKLNGLKR